MGKRLFTRVFWAALVLLIGCCIISTAMAANDMKNLGSETLSSNTATSAMCWYNSGYLLDGYVEITNAGTVHNTVTFYLQAASDESATFSNIGSERFATSTINDTMTFNIRNADGACWRIVGVANHTTGSTFTYTLRGKVEK